MNTELLSMNFFSAALLCLLYTWTMFFSYRKESGAKSITGCRQRYAPYISGYLLPLYIFVLTVFALINYGLRMTSQMALSLCFSIFLHTSLYYAVLMPMLPFLRRHISSRACAILWMIPNYLYLTQMPYMKLPMPLLVIRAPEKLVWILFSIWLIGFFAVFIRKLIEHLIFRTQILKDAEVITDPTMLALWNSEAAQADVQIPASRVMFSPNVRTPLSVGLFRRTVRVVLPQHPYTPDELSLIFRHEIIHIGREDAWAKFFLLFCTAMCWFNPLMWIAMRQSAEDLELSCDETVLLDSDENTRRRYANLILDTSGDERGFTTCLSASASAMRYRLRYIMKPEKRRFGALTVALVAFLLCISCGYVTLAYGDYKGADILCQAEDASRFTLNQITMTDDPTHAVYTCTDTEALHAYLADLTLMSINGNYSFTGDGRQFTFTYETPDGIFCVVLSDHVMKLTPLYRTDKVTSYYYVPEGVDWEYLESLLAACPAA